MLQHQVYRQGWPPETAHKCFRARGLIHRETASRREVDIQIMGVAGRARHVDHPSGRMMERRARGIAKTEHPVAMFDEPVDRACVPLNAGAAKMVMRFLRQIPDVPDMQQDERILGVDIDCSHPCVAPLFQTRWQAKMRDGLPTGHRAAEIAG